MTTFQDPPPQSRRSARQSERGDQPVEPSPFGQFSTQPQPNFVDQQTAAPHEQETEPVSSEPFAAPAAPSSGRRARAASPEGYDVAPEPLTYTTQGRMPEGYDAPMPDAGFAPTPQEPAAFRVRDYSPEGGGRRAAAPPSVEPQQPIYPAGASDLEYRTQAEPIAPPTPTAEVPPLLSRRELRERQAAMDAAAGVAPQIFDEPVAPELQTQPQQAAELPSVAEQLVTAPPPLVAPVFDAPPPAAAPTVASIFDAPPPTGPTIFDAPPPVAHERVTEPAAQIVAEPLAEPVPAPEPQAVAERETEPEQTGWVAPIGHWSRQADLDDETQPWENTITREVGGGNVATTTSALVLPEIPRPSEFSTALDSTGEVLLTGSIDLPLSLATNGGDPLRYDDSNVDLMYESQDAEFTGTDSMPVRAISAVSTQTSSRGVIHANKPHGNRLIVVVFVGTAVLAVGVVGLLVASLFMNLF